MAKTSIQVEESTRDKLRDIGKKSESYDDIILRLLKATEKKTMLVTGGIRL
jgi:hypothetical protein